MSRSHESRNPEICACPACLLSMSVRWMCCRVIRFSPSCLILSQNLWRRDQGRERGEWRWGWRRRQESGGVRWKKDKGVLVCKGKGMSVEVCLPGGTGL